MATSKLQPLIPAAPAGGLPKQPFASTPAGIAANTVRGLASPLIDLVPVAKPVAAADDPWLKVATGIGQSLARTVASAGLSAQNVESEYIKKLAATPLLKPLGIQAGALHDVEVPSYLQPLFGTGDLHDWLSRTVTASKKISDNPMAKKLGLDQTSAIPLALGSIIGNTALDLDGLGGEKSALTELAHEANPDLVLPMLKKLGLSDEVATKLTPLVAKVSREKDVKNLLELGKGMEGVSTMAKAAEPASAEAAASAPETEPPAEPVAEPATEAPAVTEPKAIPAALEPLAEEARKYPTADAFKASLSSKQLRDFLNETGAEAARTPSATATGARTRGEGDYLYHQDRGYFDAQLDDLKSGRNSNSGVHASLNDFYEAAMQREPAPAGVPVASAPTEPPAAQTPVPPAEASVPAPEETAIAPAPEPAMNEPGAAPEAQPPTEATPVSEPVPGPAAEASPAPPETQSAAPTPDVPEHAQTPAVELAKIGGGEDGKSWTSLVKGYADNLPGKAKVHILDYLATPEFVLEKIGLGKSAERLHDAFALYRKNLPKEIDKITAWRARVGKDPYTAQRIFDYLDGDARHVKSEMTTEDLAVAREIKSYLADWADRLKLPADGRLSNYITHIFDDTPGETASNVFQEDPELAAIMAEHPAGSVYDPFLQRRRGDPRYKRDVWAALDAYVKRGTRKEAMDPALEYMKEEAKKLDQSSYNYVTTLSHRINLRPTQMDLLLDNLIEHTPFLNRLAKGPRPTMFLSQKIRNLFYRGSLGLNFSSALRNLSQGANTYAKLGERYTTIGYVKTFGRLLTNNFQELKDVGVLSDEIIQDRKVGVYKSLLQKVDPVLFGMFEVAEKINRGAAFYGAKARAIDNGLPEDQAVKYATRMVRETQFAFGNVDSPVALASDLAKVGTQLGTYNIKQIEFLARMAKNKEYAGLVRYTIASIAFVATIGRTFGMTWQQMVPSIGLGGSPVGNFATGITELLSSNSQTHQQGVSDLERTAVTLIPAGAQIRKTVGGLTAYARGKDVTATGKLRYRIQHSPGKLLQAALFGKNALPEAQAYFAKLNNPKAAKKATGLTPL